MNKLDLLVRDLPSPNAARRFFEQFSERNPSHARKLSQNEGLLSDVLTIAAYSPLLATTLIQNPEYVNWLGKERSGSAAPGKDELLESLARFALTNSQLTPHVLFSRFRRRELLRIFLQDIRRLRTVAEITEQLSDLADAILEHALRLARQEMDNRYGTPFEVDEKGRKRQSDICIVALGKLGSKELNYSSDIDLLFIYSAEGTTAGGGSRGAVTDREYFCKLAEAVSQLVGRQSDEGSAYRVDLRLRPHGRVGALALSLRDTEKYYLNQARGWEQQVLIRSRASAGNSAIFKQFFSAVEETVFKAGRDPAEALRQVFQSKTQIDYHRGSKHTLDVKLDEGGIREIEFIAQALQLAYGGSDKWLRAPHTLISIARLADRGYLTEDERTDLSNAYDFLRRLEHILQMEHGLQTHSLPREQEKLELVAARMRCSPVEQFRLELSKHMEKVHATFLRVFGETELDRPQAGVSPIEDLPTEVVSAESLVTAAGGQRAKQILLSLKKLSGSSVLDDEVAEVVHRIAADSPKFAALLAARPQLISGLSYPVPGKSDVDYYDEFAKRIDFDAPRPELLAGLRTVWSQLLLDIAIADIYETESISAIRARQTRLAEASIEVSLKAAIAEVENRYGVEVPAPMCIALGKLGSGTLDYESDLDLVMLYDGTWQSGMSESTAAEIYSRLVESFVTLLSGVTRDGNLYRIDLRLRPHGKDGPNVTSVEAFADYIENAASIWELLAYAQLRGIGNASQTAETIARQALADRVSREDVDKIRSETRRIRLRLQETQSPANSRDINIKFGEGGLLDIYFATRYLYLANPNSAGPDDHSTADRLEAFHAAGLLRENEYEAFAKGHAFLSALDHNLRLILGRSSRLPRANPEALRIAARRMNLDSPDELLQQLALHRIAVRSAFESIIGGPELDRRPSGPA